MERSQMAINKTVNYYEYVLQNSIKSDIKIVLEDKTIQAHKQVLGPQNQVFFDIFRAQPGLSKIEILYLDTQAFEIFIHYLYTGRVSDGNISEELFRVAHKYSDSNLKNLCREKLGRDLSVENVVGRLLMFLDFEEKQLIKEASVFLAKNFIDVKNRYEFKQVLEKPDAVSAVFDVFDELHISILTFENQNPDRRALIESAIKSDVTIKIQNQTFLVHKNVLTSRNAIFERAFTASPAIKRFNIAKVNPNVFKEFLKCIYVGVVEKTVVSIDLMILAHAYADAKLKSACEYCLLSSINSVNAVHYLIIGIMIKAQVLVFATSKFIAHHFKEISVRPEFDRVLRNPKAVSAVFQKLSNCLEIQKSTSSYVNTFEIKVPLNEGIKCATESEKFYINKILFSIGIVRKKGKKDDESYLSIFLVCHDKSLAQHKFEFSFRLISTVDASHDISKGPMTQTSRYGFGFKVFLSRTNLNDPKKGLVEDGKIKVRIEAKYLVESDSR